MSPNTAHNSGSVRTNYIEFEIKNFRMPPSTKPLTNSWKFAAIDECCEGLTDLGGNPITINFFYEFVRLTDHVFFPRTIAKQVSVNQDAQTIKLEKYGDVGSYPELSFVLLPFN